MSRRFSDLFPQRIGIRAILLAATGLLLSCEPEPSSPVDSVRTPAVISGLQLSVAQVNTDTMLIGGQRKPTDNLTIRLTASLRLSRSATPQELLAVRYMVLDPDGQLTGNEGTFTDDGRSPDLRANDSIFTSPVMIDLVRSTVGTFSIRAVAESPGALRSATLIGGVQVLRLNQPPVLSDLVADTLISLSGPTQLIDLRVRATDPDGATDLQRVFFNTFRPDGTPSSGNPFSMFDDGSTSSNSGDLVAGDGIYSLRVQFAGATQGVWRFEFRAVDRSSDSSNVLIHRIRVAP